MDASFLRKIESQLAALPVAVAVALPSGQRVGHGRRRCGAHVPRLVGSLAVLAAGQIGKLGEDIVEGRVQFDGRVRDLMAAAAQLLPGSPVSSDTGWWSDMLRRARSMALHSPQKDAEQIQFHYDVSDDFYALWLDPRRVYSCAYFREPGMSLAQAQEAKLDHICRKLMLRPRRAIPGHRRRLGRAADVGGGALWRRRHRHHAVEEPACARAEADRGQGPAGPRAHAPARLPRPGRGAGLRQDRLGRHVRARRPRQHAACTSARSTACSSPAGW